MLKHRIPAKGYASFSISENDSFAIVDPDGRQVADLIVFDADDLSNKLSTDTTMLPRKAGRIRPSVGDSLYTSSGDPLLTITEDTCGVHDLLLLPCTSSVLEQQQDQIGEPGCLENLTAAVEPLGLDQSDIPNTFNVFMKTTVTDHDYVDIRTAESTPGDRVEFKAQRDSHVAITACADEGTVNGNNPTPIDLELPDDTDVYEG